MMMWPKSRTIDIHCQPDHPRFVSNRIDSPGKPESLFRNICIPDQHELTECDVAPEEYERKHQLGQVVIVLDSNFVSNSTTSLQQQACQM